MSRPSNPAVDDLLRLRQESLLPAPSPHRLASQIARLALRRFDRVVTWRNAREYVAALAVIALGVWRPFAGDDALQSGSIVGAAAFVNAYLWRQHRRLPRLDPAATVRAYQEALLARIDRQISLLGSARYWYLLPLYLPVLVQVTRTWQAGQHVTTVFALAVVTAIYAGLGWVNERLAVGVLLAERARVAGLYDQTEA